MVELKLRECPFCGGEAVRDTVKVPHKTNHGTMSDAEIQTAL